VGELRLLGKPGRPNGLCYCAAVNCRFQDYSPTRKMARKLRADPSSPRLPPTVKLPASLKTMPGQVGVTRCRDKSVFGKAAPGQEADG